MARRCLLSCQWTSSTTSGWTSARLLLVSCLPRLFCVLMMSSLFWVIFCFLGPLFDAFVKTRWSVLMLAFGVGPSSGNFLSSLFSFSFELLVLSFSTFPLVSFWSGLNLLLCLGWIACYFYLFVLYESF